MDRGIRGKTEKKHFATKAPLVGIRTSISERGGREGEEERSPHPPLKKKNGHLIVVANSDNNNRKKEKQQATTGTKKKKEERLHALRLSSHPLLPPSLLLQKHLHNIFYLTTAYRTGKHLLSTMALHSLHAQPTHAIMPAWLQ